MKHYYIYKPTKNLYCSNDGGGKHTDYFYLGGFKDEEAAMKDVEKITENLCRTNDEFIDRLQIELPLNCPLYQDYEVSKKGKRGYLIWLCVNQLDLHQQLEFQFRQRHTN